MLVWILLLYAKLTDGWQWERLTDVRLKGITVHILNLTQEVIHDTDERMSKMDYYKHGSLRSADFEIGYIGYQIMDNYRKMLDLYNSSFLMARYFYPMEQVLILHDIEFLYWTIEHLCNMQHEIERKYRISTSPDDYEERPIKDKPQFSMPNFGTKHVPTKSPEISDVTKRLKKPKKTKEEKYMEMMLDRMHTTRKRSTRWWWPLEYGWEIEEYW